MLKHRASIQSAPILPLLDSVLYPGIVLPAMVINELAIKAIETALSEKDKSMIVLTVKPEASDKSELNESDLYRIGTKAVISRMTRVENGVSVYLTGIERVKILHINKGDDYFIGEWVTSPLEMDADSESDALMREILKNFHEMKINLKAENGVPLSDLIHNVPNIVHQLYLIAVLAGLKVKESQKLLEASSWKELCKLMHDYLSYELNVERLRDKISDQVATELGKEQREYVLRQHLSEIQKELGEETGKEEIKELEEQMLKAELPEKVLEEGKKQLKRLSSLTEVSPEYQVVYSYLKSIIELPWNKQTIDNLDLSRAEKVLDEDHYDLKDVKERIIEQLAVLKLNPKAKAPILCFIGPPGVGKTSLGQSIARALDRKFERLSLGGMHDEAELRGHRRTYIGAMPGRIMEAIRRAGVKNPLIMMDEIDKMGVDFRGDPSAALMEILDPSQNFEFHDNYLDVPFDLSHVFFITTANTTENIPRPLLDRMEIMELSGYADYEKVEIAKKHLIPNELIDAGIAENDLHFSDDALLHMIHEYTREAGVRDLQRTISKVARKVAIKIAKGEKTSFQITRENVWQYLGHEKMFLEKVRDKWTIGISTGMAWTESGGDLIYIETSLLPHMKNELKITGHIGEIMQESVSCAVSYTLANAQWDLNDELIKDSGLHVHIPAGAIPKDGPSAGLAIVMALFSLYNKLPVRKDIAMTGEITLTGLLLPVGGVKEKVLAAHRTGINKIILPKLNEKDLEELPEQVRKEMTFIFGNEISDVLEFAIPGITIAPHPMKPAPNPQKDQFHGDLIS